MTRKRKRTRKKTRKKTRKMKRKEKTQKYKGESYPYKNITKGEAVADFLNLKKQTIFLKKQSLAII